MAQEGKGSREAPIAFRPVLTHSAFTLTLDCHSNPELTSLGTGVKLYLQLLRIPALGQKWFLSVTICSYCKMRGQVRFGMRAGPSAWTSLEDSICGWRINGSRMEEEGLLGSQGH